MSLEWGRGDRLLKKALYGKLSSSHRDRGAPSNRYKDSLKKTIGTCHIDYHQWSILTTDRQV